MLYSAQGFIVQLFEGYNLPKKLRKFLIKRKKKFYSKKVRNLFMYTKLSDMKQTKDVKNQIKQISDFARDELIKHGYEVPVKEGKILPTRLGNVLRASENYPNRRYGLDGVDMWPRLVAILPDDFVAALEEQNNRFMFLINSSLVIWFLVLCCLLVLLVTTMILFYNLICTGGEGIMGGICTYSSTMIIPDLVRSILLRLIIGSMLALVAYALYSFGVEAASDFSCFIRSGYDLYRFDLLKQLKFDMPDTLEIEQGVWKQISDFFLTDELFRKKEFRYSFTETSQKGGEKGDKKS